MDERDAKIRNQWLLILILNMANSVLWRALIYVYNPLINSNSFAVLMWDFAGLFGIGYAMYHCAYKKPGTKLVTILFIFGALRLFTAPVLAVMGRVTPQYYIPFYIQLQALSYLIVICWTLACWRIRKVNQKLLLMLVH